jgi:hypothetical protein
LTIDLPHNYLKVWASLSAYTVNRFEVAADDREHEWWSGIRRGQLTAAHF